MCVERCFRFREIGEVCKRHHLWFVVDSAQSAGTIPVNMEECGIDFLGFYRHKGAAWPAGNRRFLLTEELDKEMIPYISGGTGISRILLKCQEHFRINMKVVR